MYTSIVVHCYKHTSSQSSCKLPALCSRLLCCSGTIPKLKMFKIAQCESHSDHFHLHFCHGGWTSFSVSKQRLFSLDFSSRRRNCIGQPGWVLSQTSPHRDHTATISAPVCYSRRSVNSIILLINFSVHNPVKTKKTPPDLKACISACMHACKQSDQHFQVEIYN